MATQPEFRRRGFADLLLRKILGRGKERGYSTAQIATFVENQGAIKAYEKVGFSVTEERIEGAFERVAGSQGMAIMKLGLETLSTSSAERRPGRPSPDRTRVGGPASPGVKNFG